MDDSRRSADRDLEQARAALERGEMHHATHFRLQIDDTVVNGMDYILLDADGRIAEVTIWWRPLPSGVQMQRHLASLFGMKPWELLTHTQ